jgi:hypothetical protein
MKLAFNKVDIDNWYLIERHEEPWTSRSWVERTTYGLAFMTSSRLSDADVEGTGEEMLAIAEAIESRTDLSFRRCAVKFGGDGAVYFSSPRNTTDEVEPVSCADADALAVLIREALSKPTVGR